MSRACVLRPKRPTQRPAPENRERVGGGAEGGRRAGGAGGWWASGGGEVEYVTLRPSPCQTSLPGARGCNWILGAAIWGGGFPESGGRRDTQPFYGATKVIFSLLFLVKLQLQAEERGVVSIKGVCANRYLAMKEDGRLLASRCVTDECFFFERLESNNYNTYRSRKYTSWYVALKRTGQYKLGSKTGPGQKAILFLPMSAKS
nr:fibroblast growth factor 2 [Loxodonta africana]